MSVGLARVEELDAATVLVLEGEVDTTVAPAMEARLAEVVLAARAVVLDLAQVTFLDSAGVRLVDQLARGCVGRSLPWRVVAPHDSVARRILDLVDMVGPEVVEDREQALLSLARG